MLYLQKVSNMFSWHMGTSHPDTQTTLSSLQTPPGTCWHPFKWTAPLPSQGKEKILKGSTVGHPLFSLVLFGLFLFQEVPTMWGRGVWAVRKQVRAHKPCWQVTSQLGRHCLSVRATRKLNCSWGSWAGWWPVSTSFLGLRGAPHSFVNPCTKTKHAHWT